MAMLVLKLKFVFSIRAINSSTSSAARSLTLTGYMHSGGPRDSVRLRAAELMGKHYGLFTDRIEAVVPQRSAEEIEIQLEEKLKQFLLPETG